MLRLLNHANNLLEQEEHDMITQITPQMMEDGLKKLGQLTISEYGQNLSEIVESLKEEHGPERLYFGRLLGIMIKEPFSEVRPTPELLGTKRHWELLPKRLDEPDARATWQFQLIEKLQKESLNYSVQTYSTLDAMVQDVKHETGFFWHLLRAIRKYICEDPEFSRKLDNKMDELRASGKDINVPSGATAATIAAFLVEEVTWLGIASTPLITGIVLLLWYIGCDAFCSWSAEIITSEVWYRDS